MYRLPAAAQPDDQTPSGDVFVDKQGVLRWQKTQAGSGLVWGELHRRPSPTPTAPISSVGVGTSRPFGRTCTTCRGWGVDAFRVHVWDVEITDTLGNLLENEHLRLLDFLVS